jgi:metal-responsive CopG/Arc/MetJ family transcriptional regulator
MPALLIQLDELTLRALDQVAPVAKRQRSEFIRRAVKEAIRKEEGIRMRDAYLRQPDSEAEADDWSTCEKFEL